MVRQSELEIMGDDAWLMSAVGNNWRLKFWRKTNRPKIPQDQWAATEDPGVCTSWPESEWELAVGEGQGRHELQTLVYPYQQEFFWSYSDNSASIEAMGIWRNLKNISPSFPHGEDNKT